MVYETEKYKPLLMMSIGFGLGCAFDQLHKFTEFRIRLVDVTGRMFLIDGHF